MLYLYLVCVYQCLSHWRAEEKKKKRKIQRSARRTGLAQRSYPPQSSYYLFSIPAALPAPHSFYLLLPHGDDPGEQSEPNGGTAGLHQIHNGLWRMNVKSVETALFVHSKKDLVRKSSISQKDHQNSNNSTSKVFVYLPNYTIICMMVTFRAYLFLFLIQLMLKICGFSRYLFGFLPKTCSQAN